MKRVLYEFRGKNGQVIILKNNTVCIGRKGWFGVIYQFLTKGKRQFPVTDILDIVLKEPKITRGYIKFKIMDNYNDCGKERGYSTSVVWLTREKMFEEAQKAISIINKLKYKYAV
ncbi:MAG: hypothetical protein GX045_07640 [Clostridiaceae bacterium]|jgi:hypothetical protein|nr:hypothetical protein [Clostridiaceae bacterium]